VAGVVTSGLRYVVEMKESYEDRLAEGRAKKEAAHEASPTGATNAPAEGVA